MISPWLNPSKKRFNLIALIILLSIGWICYANCLGNEMFWDDDDFILKNRFIKDFAFWPLWFKENLVAGSYFVSNYWRPFLLFVFAHEWSWFKDNVYGWHFISVSWHIWAGVLVYFLFNRLLSQRLLSLIIAMIFIAHPVHNEAVVYVNSLGDSAATSFVLLGLLCFTYFRQSGKSALTSRSYWASLLCFPLAVLSKETGFVLCALLPFLDFILLNKNASLVKRLQSVLITSAPLIVMAIIYVILRATVLNFSNSFNFYNETNEFTSNIFLRILTFFKATSQYAGFLFCPYELRVERQMPWASSLLEPDVLIGGGIIGIMLLLMVLCWQKKPFITFALGWFFIAIIPASNVLVPINSTLYEHFLYAPMIGIVAALSYFLFTTPKSTRVRNILIAVLGGYLIFFAYKNITRNQDWHTAIGFYEKLVTYSPSYRVINNLGMEYADKGFHEKATFWYRKAIQMDPQNPVAYHNIGGALRDTGYYDEAIANFKKAIELNGKFIFSYKSLAELYWRLKNYPESYHYLVAAYNYDPTDQNIKAALIQLQEILKAQ